MVYELDKTVNLDNSILVSIVVASYNASQYIEDLLESIKKQTYPNIELVLTDDGSRDETIEKAKKWLKNNDISFEYIINVQTQNKGVTKNFNDGIALSNGKYIKIIAADDVLDEKCIENNLRVCLSNNLNYAFSKVGIFHDSNMECFEEQPKNTEFYKYPRKKQFKEILKRNLFVFAPTFFVSRAFFDEIGGFDEDYRNMEDYPLWIKMGEKGYEFHLLDTLTVYYRKNETAVTTNWNKEDFNRGFYKTQRKFFFKGKLKYLVKEMCFYTIAKELYKILICEIRIRLNNRAF